MRGFTPVLLGLLIWLFGCGAVILWNGSGTSQPRASLQYGVVCACWESKSTWRGYGASNWSLGTGFSINGKPVRWYVVHPLWSRGRFKIQWNYVIKPGVVQIPLYVVPAVCCVFPVISLITRRRNRSPWECPACGYDLRGIKGKQCPECGKPINGGDAREPKDAVTS